MKATHFGDRNHLPNRRGAMTFVFKHESDVGHEFGYRATIGYDAAGDIGELFINADRAQSMLDASASDAAIAVSLALQHGTPLEALASAMRRHQNGNPASPLGAALDLIIANGWGHNWGAGDRRGGKDGCDLRGQGPGGSGGAGAAAQADVPVL